MSSEFALDPAPTDGISSVRFGAKSSQFLLVSSWDAHVRLYDIEANRLKHSYKHQFAVLDACFTDPYHAYSGGVDCQVKTYDFMAQRETILGSHADAVRCIMHAPNYNLIITGSWDKTVKFWDTRNNTCVGTYDQPDTVYTMDVCDEMLIVGTANRKIRIWNLNNMGPSETRESSLKFQTRAVRIFPNKQAFVVSSIEGRAAVDYFDPSPEVQAKKYAFKCHRSREADLETIYPVNALAFHPSFNTFATGGSDGFVNIWDPFNKKRLCQFHLYPAGITSLAFDSTGKTLAIGSSYNYERGELHKDVPKDNVYIRRVTEIETKPK